MQTHPDNKLVFDVEKQNGGQNDNSGQLQRKNLALQLTACFQKKDAGALLDSLAATLTVIGNLVQKSSPTATSLLVGMGGGAWLVGSLLEWCKTGKKSTLDKIFQVLNSVAAGLQITGSYLENVPDRNTHAIGIVNASSGLAWGIPLVWMTGDICKRLKMLSVENQYRERIFSLLNLFVYLCCMLSAGFTILVGGSMALAGEANEGTLLSTEHGGTVGSLAWLIGTLMNLITIFLVPLCIDD